MHWFPAYLIFFSLCSSLFFTRIFDLLIAAINHSLLSQHDGFYFFPLNSMKIYLEVCQHIDEQIGANRMAFFWLDPPLMGRQKDWQQFEDS